MWSGPRNLSTAMMRSFGNRPDCTAGRRAALRRLPRRDRPRPSRARRGDRLPAHRLAGGVRGADRRPGRDAAAVPEAHDPPPAAGHRPVRAGRAAARVPGARPGAGAHVLRQGARGADAGGPRAAPAGRAVRAVRRPGRRRRRRAARPARRTLGLLCEALGHRVRRRDAVVAGRPARHRRRVGATLVRRRRGLDRLRAVLPRQRRPAAGPPAAAAGTVPALLRRAGGVPTAVPRRADAAELRRAQPRPDGVDQRRAPAPRRGGGQPVRLRRAGRRRGVGGAAALRRPDLPARPSTSRGCGARRPRWRSRRSPPTRRSSSRSGRRWPPTRCATTCTSGSPSPAA